MNLFVLSMIAAVVSGLFAWRLDENRPVYAASFIVSFVLMLMSGTRLIPESVWTLHIEYMFGALLVLGFWTLRTLVRSVMLK